MKKSQNDTSRQFDGLAVDDLTQLIYFVQGYIVT